MSSDGKTIYRPASPATPLKPLATADCAMALGPSGSSRTIHVPRMFGARIWFCKNQPLHFFVNPGPALVEPSATNTADLNYGLDWGFCEFTWNAEQIYVNVSFVDFFSLPVSLRLDTVDGVVKTVPGMPSDGLSSVCAKLEDQARREGKPWNRLVIRSSADGKPLRALSPNAGGALFPGLFDGYYKSYVDAVWKKYQSQDLTVQTQFKWGDVKGRVDARSGRLVFNSHDVGEFNKPSAQDIFTCSTGPFAADPKISDERLNVGARLAAALNRSTLDVNSQQPEGEDVDTYYRNPITNHYARICHETSLEGRGYAFPYDDVGASESVDQSGFVNAPNPKMLTVGIGKPL
ncbi:hypothetical protein CDD82_1574 [Ophiocordyceps australis]|uniref:GH64 domain-containing protein n=1 Tax=Ophiocordyceps australis TaxID=1399860 RepID=A0A2C5YES4_9HYPO|nr:hypothetical protein CDD82_1574 [Ophiocordyceps australis]